MAFPIGANLCSIHLLLRNYLLSWEAYGPIILIVMQLETLNSINEIFVIKFAKFPYRKTLMLQPTSISFDKLNIY